MSTKNVKDTMEKNVNADADMHMNDGDAAAKDINANTNGTETKKGSMISDETFKLLSQFQRDMNTEFQCGTTFSTIFEVLVTQENLEANKMAIMKKTLENLQMRLAQSV